MHRDVKMLVVACNSIEVSAIDDIAERAGIPVVGVIDPGARTAVHVTRNGRVGLIGTEATVASGAYDRAVAATGAAGHAAARRPVPCSWSTSSAATRPATSYGGPRGGIFLR